MSRKKISTTIYITPEQNELLHLLHARTKVPVAVYIREGIDLRFDLRNALFPLTQLDRIFARLREAEQLARRLTRIPLGRMWTVAEIVSLVLYLASDESAYMSGSEILIDGGAMAQ